MTAPLHLEHSRVFPVASAAAYDATIVVPLDQVFDRRNLLVAPIRRLEDQQGEWGVAGQTRTIVVGDGSRMREQLLETAPGSHFGYHLDQVRGPLRALVAEVDGRWAFADEAGGTRVTWTWDVTLLQPHGRLVGPVLRPLWLGFARKGFDRLGEVLRTP